MKSVKEFYKKNLLIGVKEKQFSKSHYIKKTTETGLSDNKIKNLSCYYLDKTNKKQIITAINSITKNYLSLNKWHRKLLEK